MTRALAMTRVAFTAALTAMAFATSDGVTQTRTVRVERGPTRAVLYWPGREPDARLPAGVPT